MGEQYYGGNPMQGQNYGGNGNFGGQYAPQTLGRYKIIHVNGENGARSLRMAPNSDVIVVDDTAPLVWLIQSDGAGYTTATPYSISPYQPPPPADVQALDARIKRLEELLNGKSDTQRAEQPISAE